MIIYRASNFEPSEMYGHLLEEVDYGICVKFQHTLQTKKNLPFSIYLWPACPIPANLENFKYWVGRIPAHVKL